MRGALWAAWMTVASCGGGDAIPPETPPPIEVAPVPTAREVARSPGDVCGLEVCQQVAASQEPPEPERPTRERPRTELLTEVATLERLLAVTPENDPDRPHLLHRVATTCVDLADAMRRDGAKGEQKARALAVARYTTLLAEYPKYCLYPSRSMPERLCGDVVAFRRGVQQALLNERAQACESFTSVLEKWPGTSMADQACAAMRGLNE